MNAATEFDLGPLTWVKGEIDLALQRAEEALTQYRSSGDQTQFKFCRTHVHQVCGALSIVGLDGATLLTETLESLLLNFESGGLEPQPAAIDSACRAMDALRGYLDDLLGGLPNQPLRLLSSYQAMAQLLGKDAHPADLFYPDLSYRVAKRDAPPAITQKQYLAEVKNARMRYQRGLLQWLTRPDGAQLGREQMREAVAAVEAMQLTSSERTFWWVLTAVMHALPEPSAKADPSVRQLCSAVDGQMRRLLEGSKSIPERLLREALYYVAISKAETDSLIGEVQNAYGLAAMLPQAAAEVTPPQDIALRKLREVLGSAEESWNKFCNGNAANLTNFVDCARLAGKLTGEVGNTDFKRLGQGFAAVANWLAEDAKRFGDAVAMEVATAILLLENAQENFAHLGSDFPQQVDLMVARLHGQISGHPVTAEKVPLLDEMTRRAQERLLIGQVSKEIQKNLGQVEQTLDTFFRDTGAVQELGQLEGQLRQIAGALAMLGHFSAVNHLKACSTKIQEFAKPGYQPSKEDFEAVANKLSMLGFFVDALVSGESDFDAFVRQIETKEPAKETVPESEEPVFAPEDAAAEDAAAVVQVVPQEAMPQEVAPIAEQAIDDVLAEMVLPDIAPLDEQPVEIRAPEPVMTAPAVSPVVQQEIDAELLSIFLEEAKEVLQTISEQHGLLVGNPYNIEALTTIRRSTHTLKGSGRMVGLTDLGEAAWELEQTLNQWLRQDQAASGELITLIHGEFELFSAWVAELEAGSGLAPDPFELVSLARKIRGAEPLPSPVKVLAPVAQEVFVSEPPTAPLVQPEIQAGIVDVATLAAPESDEFSFDLVLAEDEAPVQVAASAEAQVSGISIGLEPFGDALEIAEAVASVDQPSESVPEHSELEFITQTEAVSPDNIVAPTTDLELHIDLSPIDEVQPDTVEPLPLRDVVDTFVPPMENLVEQPDSDVDVFASADDAFALSVSEEVVPEEQALIAVELNEEFQALPLPEASGEEIAAFSEVFEQGVEEVVPVEALDASELLPEQFVAPVTQPTTLYDIFREEAKGYLHTLLESDAQLSAEPSTPTSFEMTRAAHTLGGISATVGLLPISRLAVALEHALLRRQSASNPESIEGLATVHQAIITLEQMFSDLMQQRAPDEQPLLLAALEEIFDHSVALSSAPTSPSDGEVSVSLEDVVIADQEPEEFADIRELAGTAAEQVASPLPRLTDEFDEQLLPIFLEEAADLLRDLTELLRTWRTDPSEKSVAHAIGRVLHTFKGSARMAGAMNLGELTHLLETRVEEAMHAGSATGALVDEIESGCDILVQSVDRLRDGDFSPVVPTLPSAGPAEELATAQTATAVQSQRAETAVQQQADLDHEHEMAAQKATLRVRADLVDRLVNEAGELSIARTRIEGEMRSLKGSLLFLTENVIRLRNQLREIEIQAESQIQAKVAQTAEAEVQFDPLELDRFTRFQELTRFMAESVNDVATVQQNLLKNLDDANAAILAQARLNRSLQQELMSVRMVPFASQTERLYRIVRQTAKEVGKRATLDIVGGQVDIDRSVLDKMLAPIEHMLRNAVTHGIEAREDRLAAGKKEVGEITVKLSQEGNEFILSMSDDGRGLLPERIRARAEAMGLLAPGADVDQNTLFGFIFQPGFSTASELTQLAGRGIGMDVVKTEVSALGGRIEILSQPNQGTTFRLYLPLTLAVTQTLLIRAATQRYALPSTMIEQVLELKEAELADVRDQGYVEWKGGRYPFHFLPHLLGDSTAAPEAHRQYWVLLLRSGSQRVAILVDELRGNQEVVVKNIGAQLARVVGIAGATVLGDGGVVLILNPVALASRAQLVNVDALTPAQLTPVAVQEVHLPTVMVVDDSLTVRKITSRLLTREGYTVILAKDGVDALEQLIEARPDVILSDIEMPRMDGFDFVRNVRGDERLRNIPVIMITSRTADKHRNYALEIGANHYLGKPYDEEELLGYIASFCKKPF